MSRSMQRREEEIDPEYEGIEEDINNINLQLTKQNKSSNSPDIKKKKKKDPTIRSDNGNLKVHGADIDDFSDNTAEPSFNNPNDPNAEESE